MNKECPLIKGPMVTMNCRKEKCAWYLVHSKQCAIPLIASRIPKDYVWIQKGRDVKMPKIEIDGKSLEKLPIGEKE